MLQGIPSLMVSRGGFVQPFDPMSIAGLKLWLEVDSLVLSDGDPVNSWDDSSGNGNTVIPLGGGPPTYRATGGPNSNPCVEFDGVNDNLFKSFAITIGTISQPDTVIAVYDTGRPLENDSGGPRQVLLGDSGGTIGAFAGNVFNGDGTTSPGTFIVQTAILNGASSYIYVNGTISSTSPGNAGTNGLDAIRMMAFTTSFYFAGKVCELLIYDSALSGTDRGNVEGYLASKYGI